MTRAFVDQRVADVEAAAGAADEAAARWGLSRPVLLRHGMNAIFRCSEIVLRVSTPTVSASHSIALARALSTRGIAVVDAASDDVVTVGPFSVTAWRFVETNGAPIDWSEVGRLVRRVHALSPEDLPVGVPLPSPAGFPWWNFSSMLAAVADVIDPLALAGLSGAIERWSSWDRFQSTVVCHGDVHPGNVIMTADGPVLIDWDLLCLAPAGWDHAPLMTWTDRWGGEPGIYESFTEGYGWSARGDQAAEAFAELRLVAATLMRVSAGCSDPAARPEADRRLAYWRGDPDAPTWRAQ